MVHIKIITSGGGIYSLFHWAIEELLTFVINNPISPITSFKIIIPDEITYINNKNIFDDFFENISEDYNIQLCCNKQFHNRFLKVEESLYYDQLKKIIKINNINFEILNKVNYYVKKFNINENTLGIHIRLTDMNTLHSNIGIFTINDYINKINNIISKFNNINNIFIASDNNESINTIKEYFQNKLVINYIDDTYRVDKENDDNYKFQLENINKYNDFHTKIFIELLVLSKVKYYLHRISDFSNFCILYSDSISYIESLN